MITYRLCRAARAWLGWNQLELASIANVGVSTIRDFETGLRKPMANNLQAIERALEQAGVKVVMEGGRPVGLDFSEAVARRGDESPPAGTGSN